MTFYLLYSYLETYRADNFKEAANLLAEEKHRDKIEYSQEVMQKSLASIQANATYQSVIQNNSSIRDSEITSYSENRSLWGIKNGNYLVITR